jgi:hypothetical protein
LVAKKQKLEQLKDSFPLKSQDIVNTEVEIEGLEDGLKRLEKLNAELF